MRFFIFAWRTWKVHSFSVRLAQHWMQREGYFRIWWFFLWHFRNYIWCFNFFLLHFWTFHRMLIVPKSIVGCDGVLLSIRLHFGVGLRLPFRITKSCWLSIVLSSDFLCMLATLCLHFLLFLQPKAQLVFDGGISTFSGFRWLHQEPIKNCETGCTRWGFLGQCPRLARVFLSPPYGRIRTELVGISRSVKNVQNSRPVVGLSLNVG